MLVTLDFETRPIEPRPDYPPEPVGVALLRAGRARYMAFGHPTVNNATHAEVANALHALWDAAHAGRARVLMHHAAFDLCVAREHFGLPLLPADAYEDTLPLAFLAEPDAQNLTLKWLAAKLLGREPVERDEVQAWLRRHDPESRRSLRARRARIAYAPGDLVGRYACADVEMTRALYDRLHALVVGQYGMAEAYRREKALVVEAVLDMEREGVPLDGARMRRDAAGWRASLDATDTYLRRRLRAGGLNLDARDDLADALERSGDVREWLLTEKGARSTTADDLADVCADPTLVAAIDYRYRLSVSLRNFVDPWLDVAGKVGDAKIFTAWQTIRRDDGGRARGARTGRLSSTPNLQNVPKVLPPLADGGLARVRRQHASRRSGLALPRALLRCVQPLPPLRDYIVPHAKGGALIVADYSQQELRILAHYAGGALADAYRESPDLDLHALAQRLLQERTGVLWPRGAVKTTGFGIIYGMGLARLAAAIGQDVASARVLRAAYRSAFPGLPELEAELRRRGQAGEEIRTWGGRRYVCEPPAVVNGETRTFEYKLINTLIQGSAGDVLKAVLPALVEALRERARVVLTVHDEIVASTDARTVRAQSEVAERMRRVMEDVKFTVPMRVDVKRGPTWARLEEVPRG